MRVLILFMCLVEQAQASLIHRKKSNESFILRRLKDFSKRVGRGARDRFCWMVDGDRLDKALEVLDKNKNLHSAIWKVHSQNNFAILINLKFQNKFKLN